MVWESQPSSTSQVAAVILRRRGVSDARSQLKASSASRGVLMFMNGPGFRCVPRGTLRILHPRYLRYCTFECEKKGVSYDHKGYGSGWSGHGYCQVGMSPG